MFIFFVMLLLPMLLLLGIFSYTAYLLRRAETKASADLIASSRRRRSIQNQKISATLFFVAVFFCLSWIPLHIYLVLLGTTQVVDSLSDSIKTILYTVCHIIAMSHSFHNPIIYLITNARFRVSYHQRIIHIYLCLYNSILAMDKVDILFSS